MKSDIRRVIFQKRENRGFKKIKPYPTDRKTTLEMEHIYEVNPIASSSSSSSSSSAYDFVKGFITGQVALLSLLLLIVRLLFFRSAGAVITPTTVKLDSKIFPEGRKGRVRRGNEDKSTQY